VISHSAHAHHLHVAKINLWTMGAMHNLLIVVYSDSEINDQAAQTTSRSTKSLTGIEPLMTLSALKQSSSEIRAIAGVNSATIGLLWKGRKGFFLYCKRISHRKSQYAAQKSSGRVAVNNVKQGIGIFCSLSG
jgi:hypothetical protein